MKPAEQAERERLVREMENVVQQLPCLNGGECWPLEDELITCVCCAAKEMSNALVAFDAAHKGEG